MTNSRRKYNMKKSLIRRIYIGGSFMHYDKKLPQRRI